LIRPKVGAETGPIASDHLNGAREATCTGQ
jgi:hypothetical protein